MSIVPDSKDWTWVLRDACPECGLDTRTIRRDQIPALIRDNAAAWQDIFQRRQDLAVRPRPEMWSPLEYGCHVRDVFRLYHYRLGLMLDQDDPSFPNWDQDATAIAEHYPQQHPQQVITDLCHAAAALASSFAGVPDDAWERTGNRSDGAQFTVESLARYLIHDVVHHIHDVTGTR